jgi:hypothetical protein
MFLPINTRNRQILGYTEKNHFRLIYEGPYLINRHPAVSLAARAEICILRRS